MTGCAGNNVHVGELCDNGDGHCCLPGPSTGCSPATLAGTSWGNTYYDHCNWWVRNLNVSNDTFSTNTTAITAGGCTRAHKRTDAGTDQYRRFQRDQSPRSRFAILTRPRSRPDICNISKTDNVFANNTYTWTGTGGWGFYYCGQGAQVSQSTWMANGPARGVERALSRDIWMRPAALSYLRSTEWAQHQVVGAEGLEPPTCCL